MCDGYFTLQKCSRCFGPLWKKCWKRLIWIYRQYEHKVIPSIVSCWISHLILFEFQMFAGKKVSMCSSRDTIKTDCAARCELCSVSDVGVDTIWIFLDSRYSVWSGPNSPVQPPPRTPSLLRPAGPTKPPHYFSPGWAWAPPASVCVCVCVCESMCVCLRSPLNLSRSAPTAPGLPASRDPAWVLIPGWVSLWWVMLCNLVPCSVWGLRVIRTTQHTAATTYLSVCESVWEREHGACVDLRCCNPELLYF